MEYLLTLLDVKYIQVSSAVIPYADHDVLSWKSEKISANQRIEILARWRRKPSWE